MFSDACKDLKTIATGQHDIENNDIELLCVDAEECVFAGVSDDGLVAFVFEAFLQRVRDFDFIFDDQDPHLDFAAANGTDNWGQPPIIRAIRGPITLKNSLLPCAHVTARKCPS